MSGREYNPGVYTVALLSKLGPCIIISARTTAWISMDTGSSILPSVFICYLHQRVWLGYWDIAHLMGSLSGRDNIHSSSRIAIGDSTSLVRVSSVSGVRTGLTDPALARSFTSAAAALACMRPSSASLRAKRAISESYCSHSGIFRARSSFGSFCEHRFSGLCKSESLILGKHEPSADSGRDQWSWPCVACPCCLKKQL